MNERITSIAPSVTLAITSKAKQMQAAGEAVCSFAAGEPDFDTPENIKQAAIKALEEGQTKYAPVPGLPALREAIVNKLRQENGLDYLTDQVVVSCGAKHSLFNVIMAICAVGDEVVIPAPYWLSYPEMVRVAGGVSVMVPCREEEDYKLSPEAFEAAITPRTRAIILNSPSNPIGSVYSGEELRALAEIAVKHKIYIVSDEIYEKLVYDGVEHVSTASLSDEVNKWTITVNGFSKAASMTGWRLGYIAAPLPIAKAVSAFQSHSTSGATTFAQYGAIEALTGGIQGFREMHAAFSERRAYIYERLQAIEGLSCVKPMGAFYVLPNISRLGLDSLSFAEKLLESEKVAVVPGKAFGADENVRLSYACSMDNITEGMNRLEQFVSQM